MTQPVDFQVLAANLAELGAVADAAGGHGILCGVLCGRGRTDMREWQAMVMGDTRDMEQELLAETVQLLSQLYQGTLAQMSDGMLGFDLFLPTDVESVHDRVAALSEWCSGFLWGFGVESGAREQELSAEVQEILADFVEITQVDIAAADDGEADEQAFTELHEYVRMGVLLMLEELHPIVSSMRIH